MKNEFQLSNQDIVSIKFKKQTYVSVYVSYVSV